MLKKWENTYLDIIKGDRKGPGAALLRGVLLLFSWIYLLASKFRNRMYALGFKKTTRPKGPLIISIGNIVVGGTGKTPATMMIARQFYPDTKIAFLSRGYRSFAEKEEKPTVLSRGNGPLHSALYCGDEPCIISDNFPKALSYVGKRRDIAAEWAAEAGAELILLDDGFQHRTLERDEDVIVIDTRDPFGHGHLLPRGLMREEPKGLKRASLVILNHADSEEQFESVKEAVRRFTDAPIIGTAYHVDGLIGFDGRAIESVDKIKIGIFTSIAKPDYFEKSISQLNATIVDRYTIPDHKIFDLDKLSGFGKKCMKKGAELLVCTEKDRVKLVGNLSTSVPAAWLKIRMSLTYGQNEWNSFIAKVKATLEERG